LISVGNDLTYLDPAFRGIFAKHFAAYRFSDRLEPEFGTLDSLPVLFGR